MDVNIYQEVSAAHFHTILINANTTLCVFFILAAKARATNLLNGRISVDSSESSTEDDDDEVLGDSASDVDTEDIVDEDCHYESDSGSSSDEEPVLHHQEAPLVGRNGTVWQPSPPPAHHQMPTHNIIKQQTGLTPSGRGNNSILDTFLKVICSEMIQQIVRWTNQKIKNHPTQAPKETDDIEMRAFMGLLILLGVWKSNHESLAEIWASDTGRAIFRATMPLYRFQELLAFLRFDNSNTREERRKSDKLAPSRDLWDMFQSQLQRLYHPSGFLTIDEQLLGTRGRCSFKQYIPSKPNKYGIKTFWICDSTNSYPLKGEIYLGCQPQTPLEESRLYNQPSQLVKRLVDRWKQSGRNITCDNYFTSIPLAHDLLVLDTTLVGTLRKNKQEIPQVMQANRQREIYSSVFAFTNKLTMVSYVPKKNRAVILLSSLHNDATVTDTEKSKPEIIVTYNATKGGVDNLDRLIQAYSVKRKTHRWPMTVFFNMLDVGAIAAHVIWSLNHPQWNSRRPHKRRLFLKQLGKELIEAELYRRMENPRALQKGVPAAMKAIGLSLPSPIPQVHVDSTVLIQRRRCNFCPKRGPEGDRKTKTACLVCGQALCKAHQFISCPECISG